jgi:hypothetical protein
MSSRLAWVALVFLLVLAARAWPASTQASLASVATDAPARPVACEGASHELVAVFFATPAPVIAAPARETTSPWRSPSAPPRGVRPPTRGRAGARLPALHPRSTLVVNESGFSLRC